MTEHAELTRPSDGQLHAILTQTAIRLEDGEPVYAALPNAFFAAGVDPWAAVRLMAVHQRLSDALGCVLPDSALMDIRQGEQDGALVRGLQRARRHLPLDMLPR